MEPPRTSYGRGFLYELALPVDTKRRLHFLSDDDASWAAGWPKAGLTYVTWSLAVLEVFGGESLLIYNYRLVLLLLYYVSFVGEGGIWLTHGGGFNLGAFV